MMQQLRDSTKIIMILVSISFVGLMVFEWGMDFSGRGPGGSGSPTRLGSVNGAEISIDEYQRQYRLLYEQAQQQAPDGTLSAEQQSQLEEEAWEAVGDGARGQRVATRRDLAVTDQVNSRHSSDAIGGCAGRIRTAGNESTPSVVAQEAA